ncbi:MAG: hypothetical protein ABI035_11565 [Gemmatimonadaceae bacterium]
MITTDDLRTIPLFAGIPESELESIASRVADVEQQVGDWAIQEGETASFFALLEGQLAVLKRCGASP